MSYFTEEYIRREYCDIVVIDSSEDEKEDWHGTEKHYQTAVAKKADEFVRLDSYELREFGPGGSHTIQISETIISQKDYAKAAKDKAILDTPQVRAEFNKRAKDIERAKAIRASLSAEAPACPSHGRKMKLIRGPKQYFWGCPKYPKCQNKEWLTDDQKKEAIKLDKLPAI